MLRARRLEAAALGLGGLARIAVGEDVGLRGSDSGRAKNAQTSSLLKSGTPTVHAGFSSGELGSTAGGKISGPQDTKTGLTVYPMLYSTGLLCYVVAPVLHSSHKRV